MIYHTLCKPAIDYNNDFDTIHRQKLTQNSLKLFIISDEGRN